MDNPSPYPRPNFQGTGIACPQCSSTNTKDVKYTWWGGLVGPKIMNLHKCESCRYQFNGKTLQSVKTAIWVYNIVVIVVTLGILVAVRLAL